MQTPTRKTRPFRSLFCGAALAICAAMAVQQNVQSAQQDDSAPELTKPSWKVGDTWAVEAVTDRIQGREEQPAGKSPRIRWRFKVAKLEKIAGHDCYRIEIECLAEGRLRPKTTIWCDRQTLFLRQFQTQLAYRGRYRTIRESYDHATGQFAPVLAPINALPLAVPAFVPKGAKSVGSFRYTSQPVPAGAKDPSIIRFAHAMKQDVGKPGAKSLKMIPTAYSKSLDDRPTAEVRLNDGRQSVVQIWQKGRPWPVYADNGRTRAWLVSGD